MKFKTIYDIISISGAILAFVGGYFLVRSVYASTPHQIAEMSGTYIGGNKHLELAFVAQKVDTMIGWALTFFGTTLSMTSSFWMFETQSLRIVGLITLGITSIAFLGGLLSAKFFKNKIYLKTRAISFTHHVDSYLKHNSNHFNACKLIEDAKMYYEIETLIDKKLSDYKNLANILIYSGATPGAKYILELEGKQNGKK